MNKNLEALIPMIVSLEMMQDLKRLIERSCRRDYELQDRGRITAKSSSEKDR